VALKWASLIIALLCAPIAAAQTPDTAPAAGDESTSPENMATEKPPERPFDFAHNKRLTGGWCGARPWLEERGVTIDLGLTTIYQHNAKGGVQTRHAHRVSGSYDLETTFDFEKLKLWKGGILYALAEGSSDDGISNAGYVGDLFGVNGYAAGPQEIQLSELWYEHTLLDEKLRVRFGKLDLTTDFDTNAFANDETAQFLNRGLINGANIPFPDRGHGIQFVAVPVDWLYFAAGVADAEADSRETGFRTAYHGPANTFSVYEFGLTPTWETGWGQLPGNYRFGLWYDPQPKERFFNDLGGRLSTPRLKRDDVGFYLNFDQAVLRENPQVEGDEQGLGLFLRYAYAHDDVNAIEHFWSVGGQYQGLIPTRDEDVLAFGVAQGVLSERMRLTGADPHRETALELYYRIQVLPWLTLSPDLQWILRPGGEDGRDAFVAGIRLQMAF
jgi:carbohydrate-selective porin OprB